MDTNNHNFDDDHDDHEEFVVAQMSAYEEYQRQKLRNEHETICMDHESEALARAIAQSEYEDGTAVVAASEEVVASHQQRQQQGRVDENNNDENDEQESVLLARAIRESEEHAKAMEIDRTIEEDVLRHKQAQNEDRNIGSWDCLSCTYTNLPYRPKCAMCQQQAPSTVLSFAELLPSSSSSSSSRFGVEIEIIVSDGKSDGYTHKSIAECLSKLGTTVVFKGYCHETMDTWKLVTDRSLQGNSRNDLCFELVSPVLDGEDGIISVRSLLDNVRKIGIATNQSCGFHVHVDATTYNANDVMQISRSFVALENAFDLLLCHRRRANENTYCSSNRFEFGSMSNKQRWDWITTNAGSSNNNSSNNSSMRRVVTKMCPTRYKKLNLTNLINPSRPSTIEFRQHGGIEQIIEAEAWIRLVVRFCHQVTTSSNNNNHNNNNNRCLLLLPESATPEDELWALFDVINCQGLEQYYMAEKQLFLSHKRTSNHWQCCTCKCAFHTSRSLAQHQSATGH